MASDETMNFHSSLQDEELLEDDNMEDGYDDHQRQYPQYPNPLHNMSRLSVCTSSTLCGDEDEDDDVDNNNNAMAMYVSQLSLESYEEEEGENNNGDIADAEFSDDPKHDLPTSDSENESGGSAGCYSLPATPPRRRNRVGSRTPAPAAKEYASDNDAHKWGSFGMGRQKTKNHDPWRWRRRRNIRERWVVLEGDKGNNFCNNEKNMEEKDESNDHGVSGESSDHGGVRVITRPKGGRRSLCMDMEEIKACKDLGFELENEKMVEMPSRLSLSNSTLDTSSGGNSPIANWRISSPGMIFIPHYQL